MSNTWSYRQGVREPDVDLGGFDVEALDGSIGSVDEDAVGPDYVIVDTGFWIFGKRRLVPAGVIDRIDYQAEKVYLNMSKDQVKNAPDLDETIDRTRDDWRDDTHGSYYDPYGWQ